MISYLLTVSFCWIILYGLYLTIFEKETFFISNRSYLMTSLLLGIIIPAYQWIPSEWFTKPVEVSYYFLPSEVLIEAIASPKTTSMNWMMLLGIVYWTGVAIMSTKFIHGLYRIAQLKYAGRLEYINKLKVIYTQGDHLPFSFMSSIYISEKLPLKDSFKSILQHEEVHVKSWHSIDVLFIQVLHILFWFNPILIYYKKSIQQLHEFAADATVIKDISRKSYGQLLLRQSQSGLEIALANHFFHSQIKKRITMMYKEKSKRPAMAKYLMALPVLLLLLVSFSSDTNDPELEHAVLTEMAQRIDKGDAVVAVHLRQIFNRSLAKAEDVALMSDQIRNLAIENGFEVTIDDKVIQHLAFSQTFDNITVIADGNVLKGDQDYTISQGTMKIQKGDVGVVNVKFDIPCKKPMLYKGDYKGLGNVTILFCEQNGKITYAEIVETESTVNKPLQKEALAAFYSGEIKRDKDKIRPVPKPPLPPPPPPKPMDQKIHLPVPPPPPPPPPHHGSSIGDDVFKVVEYMPRFKGCENLLNGDQDIRATEDCAKRKMLEYIYKNLKYPAEAREKGVEGTTVVQFVINTNGIVENVNLLRDIGAGAGDEAVRVVKSMNDNGSSWVPGRQKGKDVKVMYTLPIKYKLEAETAIIQAQVDVSKKSNSDEIYKVVERMPRFPGCEGLLSEGKMDKEVNECARGKMFEYIGTNVKYPAEAKQKSIEGVTVVQFVVKTDGTLSDINLMRDIGGGAGEESVRVIESMNEKGLKWTPGMQSGKLVNVQYTLPIKYKLEGGSKDKLEGKKIGDKKIRLSSSLDKSDPLIIVNGKIFNGTADQIKPDDIESMNVYKGDKAVEKFGERAREGVLDIKLKGNLDVSDKKLNLTVFTLSPNPTSEQFTINIEGGSEEELSISVYDVTGRIIYSERITGYNGKLNKTIQDAQFKNKIAYVELKQNGKSMTKKIIFN